MTRRAALGEEPLAFELESPSSEFTYATTFQRCSGVRLPANPTIGVPAMPIEVMRNIIAGVMPLMCAAVPIGGGLGCMPLPAGPSPPPARPWQLAHDC